MPKNFKTSWAFGDKSELARRAGISPQYLSDIIAGRKTCSSRLGTLLAKHSMALGYDIPRSVWVFQDMRVISPLFF